jgi:hypothetical protein
VRLGEVPSDVSVEYRADVIKLFVPAEKLSSDNLYSHALTVDMLLRYVGPIIDIELILDNFSIYFMLTQYTGDKYIFRKVKRTIEERAGSLAYTIPSKIGKETER